MHPRSLFVLSVVLIAGMLAGGCSESRHHVQIEVAPPSSTPPEARLFVAGNLPSLGDWRPNGKEMKRATDSLWTFAFSVAHGRRVEFKVTLGNWQDQAIYEPGIIPPNIAFTCVGDTSIRLRPISWGLADSSGGGITGVVQYHRNLAGEGLHYKRDLIVWLPPSYEREPSKRYPVLYMHDGQNVFDPRTSFIGYDWHVDEVADSLIRAGAMREIIMVAITNSPDRVPEYSDTPLGRSYADFVVHRVKPLIDSTYRTLPGPDHTGVMGSSMGGLISFLFAWWYPDVFGQAACLSSAFLFDDGKTLREVESYSGAWKPIRIYADCGGADLDARLLPGHRAMVALLQAKGYREGIDLCSFEDPGATHNERAWAERVWRPLEFMFGTLPPGACGSTPR